MERPNEVIKYHRTWAKDGRVLVEWSDFIEGANAKLSEELERMEASHLKQTQRLIEANQKLQERLDAAPREMLGADVPDGWEWASDFSYEGLNWSVDHLHTRIAERRTVIARPPQPLQKPDVASELYELLDRNGAYVNRILERFTVELQEGK